MRSRTGLAAITLTGLILTVAGIPPVQAATAAAAAGPTVAAATQPSAQPASPAKKKAKKKKAKLTLAESANSIILGNSVLLTAQLHPQTVRSITFQYAQVKKTKKGKTKKLKWKSIGKARTDGHGITTKTWKPPKAANFSVQAIAKKTKKLSKASSKKQPLSVKWIGPKPDQTVTAAFPAKATVDVPFSIPVTVTPAQANITVQLQQYDSTKKTWSNSPGNGASGNTDASGKVTLTGVDGYAGTITYRVLSMYGAASPNANVEVDSAGLDAFYASPESPPTTPGTLIRTMPMQAPSFPKEVPLPQLPKNVSTYRMLYSTMRASPVDGSSTPAVTSGMVYIPPVTTAPPKGYTESNRPVVVWAHPTLGLAAKCAPSTGSEGYYINYLDVSWFLAGGGESLKFDASSKAKVDVLPEPGGLLANGYVVVMPDYLGIATERDKPDTYLIGQQEANDVIYAVKAIQTGASADLNWPGGVPSAIWPGTGAGADVVVAGHSQGGHAALWTGVNRPLAQSLGLNLKGIVAVAPASDLTQTFGYGWNTSVGWVIGPYGAKTFIDYFGDSYAQALTPQGAADYAMLAQMCVTDVSTWVSKNIPLQPGSSTLVNPTFSIQPDMSNPVWGNTWGAQLNLQTPLLQGQAPAPGVGYPSRAGYPKDLPTFLVQGQGDNIVIAQTNAALQETMCKAGFPLDAYYPAADPIGGTKVKGVYLPGVADHVTILNWPIPDDPLSLLPGADILLHQETPSSRVAEWVAARFNGVPQAVDCDADWTFTSPPKVTKTFTFKIGPKELSETITIPLNTTGVHKILPMAPCATTNGLPFGCQYPVNYKGVPELFQFIWAIGELADSDWAQTTPLSGNAQFGGMPRFPAFDWTKYVKGLKLNDPGAVLYTISNQTGLFPYGANVNFAGKWTFATNPSLPGGYMYSEAGGNGNKYDWGFYPSNGTYYR